MADAVPDDQAGGVGSEAGDRIELVLVRNRFKELKRLAPAD